jgi:hypothetical protein
MVWNEPVRAADEDLQIRKTPINRSRFFAHHPKWRDLWGPFSQNDTAD